MLEYIKNLRYFFFPRIYKLISNEGIFIYKLRFRPFKGDFICTYENNDIQYVFGFSFKSIEEFEYMMMNKKSLKELK